MRTYTTFAALLLVSTFAALAATNDEAPLSPAEVRALRQRIDELEQKVKALEQGQGRGAQTNQNERLQDLDQKVKILERNRELDEEAAAEKAKEMPRITLGEEGFTFTSADTNFSVRLAGVLQVDTRSYFGDLSTGGSQGILLRRARPILQGTVCRDFDFQFVPDFGGSGAPQIYDAFVNYRNRPELQLTVGKFRPPIGLEQLVNERDTLFNERALPTDLVPNRDLGFLLHGDLVGGTINYGVGLFNGLGDGRNSSNVDIDGNLEFAGRVLFSPFKTSSIRPLQGLTFGVAGSYTAMHGTNTTGLPNNVTGSLTIPGYQTVGQREFFAYNPTNGSVVADGEHWRLSPQGTWYYGPFGLLGEYVISDQQVALAGVEPTESAHLQHNAWQIQVNWVLTGEDSSYTGVTPRHPLNPAQGHWGAWQLIGRYSQLNLDPHSFPLFSNPATSAEAAYEWAVGFDWYLNRNIKVIADYSHTDFKGGGGAGTSPPATVTRKPESVFFTRVQLAF